MTEVERLNLLICTYMEMNNLTNWGKVIQDMHKGYISKEELLDTWLQYEGILGYTGQILDSIRALDMYFES